eukprot:12358445-Alexandrium_andersonii.AAC.1
MESPKATLVWASRAAATGLPMSTLAAESIGASPLSSTLRMAPMCATTEHSAETMGRPRTRPRAGRRAPGRAAAGATRRARRSSTR